jgi:hypothetical protein
LCPSESVRYSVVLAPRRKSEAWQIARPPEARDPVWGGSFVAAVQVERRGLKPEIPPEITEEGQEDAGANVEVLRGVYLTTAEIAAEYLRGRYAGEGSVMAVHLPEGLRVYHDPVDDQSVFVRVKIPAYAVSVLSE